jgi:prevent-host-death family protein
MNIARDINSLSNFKRNTSDFLKQMRRTRQPIVLTVNGKAEFVVQDATSYQELLEVKERWETIQSLRRGLAEMERGEGQPFAEAVAVMRAELGVPEDE